MSLRFTTILLISTMLSTSALAGGELKARSEVDFHYSSDRAITMSEFWVPFMQNDTSVLYGNLRMMGDNQDNREGNPWGWLS